MPIICIQCSLRALVNKEPPPVFEGALADHMQQYHPDPDVTHRERLDLERRLRAAIPEAGTDDDCAR